MSLQYPVITAKKSIKLKKGNSKKIASFMEWLKTMAEDHAEIEKIILYGSFSRGDATDGSDIDLAFFISDMKKWPELAEMIRENANTLRGLDLVCFQEASAMLQEKIKKEGVIFFERRKSQTKSS